MIRVERPREAPGILVEKGALELERLLAAYRADPEGSRRDLRRMMQQGVYGGAAVKQALSRAQHGKCAYCEIRIESEWGTVDHYRPKGAVRQTRSGIEESPGYFWLAYTWENLLVACSRCNMHKGDLFPLARPRDRARVEDSDAGLAREAPLLIDPTAEDPELHICFDAERAYAIDVGRRAGATIEMLGLNSPVLLDARRNDYQLLSGFLDLLETARTGREIPDNLLIKASRFVATSAMASGRFAAMVRALIRSRAGAALATPYTVEGLMRWAQPVQRDDG